MKFQQMVFVTNSPEQARLEEVVEAVDFMDMVRKTFFVKGFDDEEQIKDMFDSFTLYDDNGQQKYMSYGEEVIEIFFVIS